MLFGIKVSLRQDLFIFATYTCQLCFSFVIIANIILVIVISKKYLSNTMQGMLERKSNAQSKQNFGGAGIEP